MAVLYAPWGQGKSFVGAELAGAISQGRPFGGGQVRKGLVLYLIGEGAFDMRERFKSLIDDGRVDKSQIYISTLAPQIVNTDERRQLRAEIKAWLAGRQLGIIVVDTLAVHSNGVEENSASQMGTWLSFYRSLGAEFGATILFIHHAGKDADKGTRGSTAIPGAMSTMIFCEKIGDEITLHCVKQRGAKEFDPVGFQMRRVNGSAVLDQVGASDHFSELEQLILDQIVSSKDGFCETRHFVHSDGKVPPKVSLHRALGSLLNRNKIIRLGRGKYASAIVPT